MLKQRIEQDLKQALLGGDKAKAMVLRSLKSAILYAEVDQGVRDEGLNEQALIALVAKEAKKRQESADLYEKNGELERAGVELAEKNIILNYLPEQLSDDDLRKVVDEAVGTIGAVSSDMGRVIGLVKAKTAGKAEGSRIASLVKQVLAERS